MSFASGMTAPDHTPYLLATDLRTPEDVANWLGSRLKASIPRGGKLWSEYHVLEAEYDALAERLDRERRQACRRGALSRFEMFAWYARLVRADKDWELDNPELASEMAWDDAAACIAFRAAARQP